MKNTVPDYLDEIMRVREKLAARYGYDIHRMVQHLKKVRSKHGKRLVRAPIRRRKPLRSPKRANSSDKP